MITPEILEEIKYRCDIVDVISDYVSLKRAGANYVGLCPFHSEKTPSFSVSPSTRLFYCFGCGVGGTVFNFIMRRENVDFYSAVEILAKRAGIKLPDKYDGQASDQLYKKRERILSMNREVARFYHRCLYSPSGEIGLNYLHSRGLSDATIKHFGLGFAPSGFGAATDFLQSRGYTVDEMKTAFLCGISTKTGKPYDYFFNRVIFPIIDVSGNVVAFGGRVMDDSLPKYLNTSDTPAFKKSRNLFALNFARSSCSERLILCEGYMDVIACHANGFENAVATLGTAITPEQARIMKNYTKQVVISYDSDAAGQRATSKAMKLLADVGLDVKILRITGAKDPDEFFKNHGRLAKEKFKLALDQSRAGFEFKLESVLAAHDISVVDEKIKAARELCQIISEVTSQSERDVYIGVVSQKLEIPRDSLANDVKRIMRSQEKDRKKQEFSEILRSTAGYGDRINSDTVKNAAAVSVEENILGILLLYPENLALIRSGELSLAESDFFSEFGRRVFGAILRLSQGGGLDFGMLSAEFSPDEMGRITGMSVRRQKLTQNGRDVLEGMIARLKSETAQSRADAGGGIAAIDDILRRQREKLKK